MGGKDRYVHAEKYESSQFINNKCFVQKTESEPESVLL